MRAHNVIIICSGQGHLARTDILAQTVQNILNLKKNPILVLGPDGDNFIEGFEAIEKCDIVFDPNFTSGSLDPSSASSERAAGGGLFSSVKAGLHATHGAAFVVPLSEKTADPERWSLWVTLEKLLVDPLTSLGADMILPVTREADFLPRLITARGVTSLKKLPAATDWPTSWLTHWDSSDQVACCSLYLVNKDC
jgi:hypothetical protein